MMNVSSEDSRAALEEKAAYHRRSKKTLAQVCNFPLIANIVARAFYFLSRICSIFLHEKSLPCDPDHNHITHTPMRKPGTTGANPHLPLNQE